MDPKTERKDEKELEKAINQFAEDFVENGKYPDNVSNIEISLYSILGRDVL